MGGASPYKTLERTHRVGGGAGRGVINLFELGLQLYLSMYLKCQRIMD